MSLDLPKEHQLRYLSKRAADIEAIKNGAHNNDFEVAVMIGHRLKGSGETFGFPLITTHGNTIELAGLAQDKAKILAAVDLLSESVQTYLQKMQG